MAVATMPTRQMVRAVVSCTIIADMTIPAVAIATSTSSAIRFGSLIPEQASIESLVIVRIRALNSIFPCS